MMLLARKRCVLLSVSLLVAALVLVKQFGDESSATGEAVSQHDGAGKNMAAGAGALPSVRAGLTHTANDLSTETVQISNEIDGLTHMREARGDAAGAPRFLSPMKEGGTVPVSPAVLTCPAALQVFSVAHSAVLRANADHLRTLSEPPPDRWSGPSPVCGVHALFNATRELYVLRGDASGNTFSTGTTHSIRLENCNKAREHLRGPGEPAAQCTDLYIAARLVGPSIVAVQVTRQPLTCDFVLAFEAIDTGTYHLEVQLVWLDGLGPERNPPTHPLVLRKVHSKFGKKPHQKYVFNEACEQQTHVMGSPLQLDIVAATMRGGGGGGGGSTTEATMPVCSFGLSSSHGYGRWLFHRNDFKCNASTPYCMGDPILLNDAKPFNEDFVWAPYRCKLHYYNYKEGPTGPCVKRSGTMLLMGDSTTREYAQSLKLFDLSKTNLRVEYANWKLDWQYFSRPMAQKSVARLGKELQGSKPVVLVANLGPLHLIGGLKTEDWQFYVDQWVKLFRPEHDGGGSGGLDFIEKKVFLGPAAIHYATNDMTAQRMLNWMAYAYEMLSPLGFEYVAAWNMTEARAEASWDGVHYSAERGKAQMKKLRRRRKVFKWNGGVSVMLTTALLNMLCTPNH